MKSIRFKDGTLREDLFKEQVNGDLVLLIPSHSNAVGNEGWNKSNLWYRSRIETTMGGRTISQGFGKFFNLGQGSDELRVDAHHVIDHIREGKEVIATLKYDGSCFIRSVYNGKVIFRTRGSFLYEHHDKASSELDEFLRLYPRLNDPEFYPEGSLLFEWVTPENQIVIKYNEPQLVIIGAVDHANGEVSRQRYLSMVELELLSKICRVPLVEHFKIDSLEDWYAFYHETLQHKEIEGYVLRLNAQQTLVKIKSEPYITKHGIKSNLSFKSLVEFWLQHGRGSGEEIIRQLETQYDEEIVMWAMPFCIELEDAIDKWQADYERVRGEAEVLEHADRKTFAIKMQEKFKDDRLLFNIAMLLWEGKDVDNKIVRNYMKKFDVAKDKIYD